MKKAFKLSTISLIGASLSMLVSCGTSRNDAAKIINDNKVEDSPTTPINDDNNTLNTSGNYKSSIINNDARVLSEGDILDAYQASVWGNPLPVKTQGNRDNIHYTGQGFVKDINSSDSGMTFHNISVSETGCYPLYVRYCTDSNEASIGVYVKDDDNNKKFYGAIDCNIKTGWDYFTDYSIGQTYINLESGKTYSIDLKKGHYYAEVDYIKIGPRVGNKMTRYEAEDYRETTGVTQSTSSFASNEHGAADITSENGVDFVINVEKDGRYDILINQCSDGGMTNSPGLSMAVDNTYLRDVDCVYKTGWGVFDVNPVRKVSLSLTQGNHHIRLVKKAGDSNYVQLDYIDVKESEYIRFEAEEGITNASLYADETAKFSGTGYVGDINKYGIDYIAFPIKTNAAGNYYINICYAMGGGVPVPATFTMANNDGNYTIAYCAKVNEWGKFDDYITTTCSVKLDKGDNVITLFKRDSYAQIDYIEISDLCINAKAGDCEYRRIEAEDANIMNTCIKPSGSASGSRYVGDLDDNYYVEFPVYVAKDGAYEIAYSYCRPGPDYSVISVTGGSYGREDRPYINFVRENNVTSSGWGNFSSDTTIRYNAEDTSLNMLKVNLKAGYSYIAVRPEAASKTFELDFIEIGRRVGDYDVSKLGIDPLLDRGN